MISVVIGLGIILGLCGLAFVMALAMCEAVEAYCEWKERKR